MKPRDCRIWYADMRKLVREKGVFQVGLIPYDDRHEVGPDSVLRCHDQVLRPLLEQATDCYVYPGDRKSLVTRVARKILTREGARYRMDLSQEVIRGYEALWNAAGGDRGSIAIVCQIVRSELKPIFAKCYSLIYTSNFRAGHNPAAITYCRKATAADDRVAFCLSRNNGIDWLDVIAPNETAVKLFSLAAGQIDVAKKDVKRWYY